MKKWAGLVVSSSSVGLSDYLSAPMRPQANGHSSGRASCAKFFSVLGSTFEKVLKSCVSGVPGVRCQSPSRGMGTMIIFRLVSGQRNSSSLVCQAVFSICTAALKELPAAFLYYIVTSNILCVSLSTFWFLRTRVINRSTCNCGKVMWVFLVSIATLSTFLFGRAESLKTWSFGDCLNV